MNRAALRRWFISTFIGGLIMVADVTGLALATRAFSGHPPRWVSGIFFWFLAWPVPFFQLIFPQPPTSTDDGPTILALVFSAAIDLALLSSLVYWLMYRRHSLPPRSFGPDGSL